ncbi:MAG TPA: phenylalanine--tRNA ligase subunit beta [Candidatus Binataceae bacterium]|nr:phenylalanine--tRNA ligase subunit beta [Candidatus Binataceae bacterium]
MKLPLSWLREMVAIEAPVEELARRLSVAGLSVENIEHHAATFSGVIVAKVLEAGRHPNADRLSLCRVDAGGAGEFTVVCGATNVRAGMIAAFAQVGARLGAEAARPGQPPPRLEQVPPLEAAVIRGVRSEGMLCSERELGLSTEHAGILALPATATPGADVAEFLHLADTVLDVEITPNRGDCLSILGLAREVGALFSVKLKLLRHARAKAGAHGEPAPFAVEMEAPDLCPRYAGLAMDGIKIGPSPILVRRRLELCGMRALNNVVDATNYVMLERGQPLHAFDLEKIAGRRIVVRRAGADREFTTLDNLPRALDPDDLVIADAEKVLAIAGVMGGLNSEVSDSTTAILLESAYFEPPVISRTARRLSLRSEASYRFERAVDRAGQAGALARVAGLIGETAGGRQTGPLVDCEARRAPAREIDLDLAAMGSLLGATIAPPEVKRRLRAIGTKVSAAGRGVLKVVPPSFRSDLNEPADLAEEVVRLTGLDDIPSVLPPRSAAIVPANRERELMRATREVLMGCGLTEALTIAFQAPADNARFPGLDASASAVEVSNPLSAELGELRLSLIPGLLAALRFNLNREAPAFHAFEFGKVFMMREGRPAERLELGAISYGPYVLAAIGEKGAGASYFSMKGILETYFQALGIAPRMRYRAIEPREAPYLHPGRAARITLDAAMLGYVGELHPAEAMRLDLADSCALYELDLAELIAYGFSPRKTIEPPPRFPAIRRDLALVVDRDFPADMVMRTIQEAASSLLESVEVFDVYAGGTIAPGKKSLALACRYRAKDRTLTDEEVNRVHAALTEQARTRLGAELRQ